MGKSVEFSDVAAQIARYGQLASLVSVGDDQSPHIGTVLVDVIDGALALGVGSTTRGNVLARPAVTLAWLRDGVDYQLILDGTATVGDQAGDDGLYPTTVTVHRGILHRVAGHSDAGPSCKALADDAVC